MKDQEMDSVMETVAAPCDMMNLFERAFNTGLCKEMVDRADRNLSESHQVEINGVLYEHIGSSINFVQVLRLSRRDWCNTNYEIFYREDSRVDAPMKEMKPGVAIRLTPYLAFIVRKNEEDHWAQEAAANRFLKQRFPSAL